MFTILSQGTAWDGMVVHLFPVCSSDMLFTKRTFSDVKQHISSDYMLGVGSQSP